MSRNETARNSAKIVIINQHSSNVGDEAAGYALIDELINDYRIESIDILYNGSESIPCPPDSLEIVRHDLHLSLKKMGHIAIAVYLLTGIRLNDTIRSYCRLIEGADQVVVAPGGANIGIYKDWRYLVRLLLTIKTGKTPLFHWNTIGKSGSKPFDFLARKVLKNSRLYVREKKSQRFLESMGLQAELGPDTAFLLRPIPFPKDSNTIVFVPSELDSWHPYYKQCPINEVVLGEYVPVIGEFALKHGYSIDILPHLMNTTEKQFNEDVFTILKEAGCAVTLRDDINDFRDYDMALAHASIVVGMRYHTAVLAAKNYRPYIALAYENKAIEVADYTGMTQYCVDLHGNRVDGATLLELLVKLDRNKEGIPSQLREVCERSLKPRAASALKKELSNFSK